MFTNPVTGKKHRGWDALHRGISKELRGTTPTRGAYDEILSWPIPLPPPFIGEITFRHIIGTFRPALEDEYCEFDKKGRGTALNHDLYGYDPDQGVAVVQARQAFRRHKNDYINVRKTYFLVGRNEITGEYFRHPVSSAAVRGAIRVNPHPAAVVKAVQRWMWEVTEQQLARSVRQGDVLLVPEREPKSAELVGTRLIIAESHVITATEIRLNGRCWALNPTVVHQKGQHAPVAMEGWCSIRIAREVSAWNFATRIGD